MRTLLLSLLLLLLPTAAYAQEGDDDDSAEGDDDDSAAEEDLGPPEWEGHIDALESELEALKRSLEPPPKPRARRPLPKLKLDVGGRISSDIRFRVKEVAIGDWYDRRTLPVGFDRNENIAKLKIAAEISRFRGVVEMDFVLTGFPQADDLPGLSDRGQLQPLRIETHAAYIHARDLLFKGLDVRLGQQLVQWGVGDQFNPTNLLNADDLEDTLLFGEQQANLMARIDWTPLPSKAPNWTFSFVAVPIFRPALVPPSGELAIAATDRLPWAEEELRWRVHSEQEFAKQAGLPTIVGNVLVDTPAVNLRNVQLAARMAATVLNQDLAISFYRGFDDFPVPLQNYSAVDNTYAACENDPPFPEIRDGEPDEDEDCIDGVVSTTTTLHYPRVHVLGFNLTGEIPGIGLGYRLELGVFFPNETQIALHNDTILIQAAGEYDYDGDGEPGGPRPTIVSNKPFAKWVLGFDYMIGGVVMLNAMWVHGNVNEFGAGDFLQPVGWAVRQGAAVGRLPADEDDGTPLLTDCALNGEYATCAQETLRPKLADYLVFGMDLNFARNAGLIRIFTIFDLSGYTVQGYDIAAGERTNTFHAPFSEEGFSAVIYPSINWNFGYGFELGAGALFQLGKSHTVFGDPAAGGSVVFVNGKYSF
ncbi:MAG: hypothetical protein GY898_30720 [Proteobacteria bacterium]|nr:hypothetical protein [Pseudomonadota bacterium]